jgi:excisionase family DNA binding protein
MTHSGSGGLARFLTLADVATELAISVHQAYALVRSGELPAIKVGGHWRVENVALESFIADKYEESRRHALWQQAQYADVAELFGDR